MLKARRRELKRNARTVFDALKVSRNHLSAIENGRTLPTEPFLVRLTGVLDYDATDTEYLVKLLGIARDDGWWDEFARYVPSELIDLCGLEYGAESVRVYDPIVVTGLLQTEEYARAIIGAVPQHSKLDVDRFVRLRMKRQERLRPPDAVRALILQGETALHQQIGGVEVLRRQLTHIVDLIESLDPSLEFRIQPFTSTPAGFVTAATIVLLDFTTPYLDTWAWTTGATSVSITDDLDALELIEANLELALNSSLDRESSYDLVRRRIAQLDDER